MDGVQLSIEYDNGRLVFSAGQYLGAVAPNFIYSCIIANTQDITGEKRCQYVATPKLESEKVTFSFIDNGTFPGATAVGLFFAAFSLKEPAANVYVGGLNQAINIVMTKQ